MAKEWKDLTREEQKRATQELLDKMAKEWPETSPDAKHPCRRCGAMTRNQELNLNGHCADCADEVAR